MENNRLLIVDPNFEFAKELQAVAKGVGFIVDVAIDADSAEKLFQEKSYAVAIVECMLPGRGGVDLVKALRNYRPNEEIQVFLMSGIFTDRGFVREALDSTGATDFFKKPFQATEILNHISSESFESKLSAEKNIYLVFSRTKISAREKRKMIESLDKIHSYDLPFVLSLLVEIKASGHLNIVDSENRISGISFSKGNIVQVDIADKSSFLGQILVNKGFVLPEDLERVLNDPASENKRIATRLIEANVLSPHGFDDALREQMNIRLSKVIFDIEVKVNFVAGDVPESQVMIDPDGFLDNLYVWVMSKISQEWLLNHYLTWAENPLKFGAAYSPQHPIFNLPIFESQGEDVEGSVLYLIKRGKTISQIAENPNIGEEQAYKVVHLLLCKGMVLFDEKRAIESPAERLNRLNRILQQLMTRDDLIATFELMGGKRGLAEADVTQVYRDFLRSLGAEVSAQDEAALRKVYQDIRTRIDASYKLFLEPQKLAEYEQAIQSKIASQQLKLQADYDEAKLLLTQRKFQAALALLHKLTQSKAKADGISLYLIWAKIGIYPDSVNKEKLLKDIDLGLSQISADERHTPMANFLFGLFYKIKNDLVNSRKSFERALTMDPNMAEAKRELNLMAIQLKAKKENKGMLSKLFGR